MSLHCWPLLLSTRGQCSAKHQDVHTNVIIAITKWKPKERNEMIEEIELAVNNDNSIFQVKLS